MKIAFKYSRLFALAATVLLVFTSAQPVRAVGIEKDVEKWFEMRIQGTATIQSITPVGGDPNTILAEVVATESGRGNLWGNHESVWTLLVEIDAATQVPLRGSGEIVQTNEDGSTITFHTRFEGNRSFTIITGGTGRFEHAIGGVRGKTVQNPDGTISFKDKGWITGPGLSRGEKDDEEED